MGNFSVFSILMLLPVSWICGISSKYDGKTFWDFNCTIVLNKLAHRFLDQVPLKALWDTRQSKISQEIQSWLYRGTRKNFLIKCFPFRSDARTSLNWRLMSLEWFKANKRFELGIELEFCKCLKPSCKIIVPAWPHPPILWRNSRTANDYVSILRLTGLGIPNLDKWYQFRLNSQSRLFCCMQANSSSWKQ